MAGNNYWKNLAISSRASRRRFLAGSGTAALGTTALGLVGCGDDSASSNGSTSTKPADGGSGTPQSATSPAAAAPKTGGILNVVSAVDYSFDSIIDSTSAANIFSGYMHSRLVKFVPDPDFTKAAGAVIAPDLGSVPEQPDKLTYTFKLNPAAKFHNKPPVNGRAVTTDDVLQSYRRIVSEPKNTNKDALLAAMDGEPVAIDDHTIQLKTKMPYAPFLAGLIANPQFLWIWPKELLANDSLRTTNPVGAGPWMFKARQQSVSVEFEKNPDYYLKDSAGRAIPYLDGVKVNVIPDASNQLAQFAGGNVSTTGVNYADLDTVKSLVKGIQIFPSKQIYWYFSPQQRPERGGPWLDKRMRQALSLALDRPGMLKLFWDGTGQYYGLTSPVLGSWSNDMLSDKLGRKQWYTRDLKMAKDLLSAAGYTGQPLRYIYPNNAYGDQYNQFNVFLASNLKEAGFNVQLITQDYRSEFITAGKTFFGNYDGLFFAPEAPQVDPHPLLYHMLYKDNAWNHAGINDSRADALVDKLGTEFDRTARKAIVDQIDQLNADEMYYITPAVGNSYTTVQPNVRNFAFASHSYATGGEVYSRVWLDKP